MKDPPLSSEIITKYTSRFSNRGFKVFYSGLSSQKTLTLSNRKTEADFYVSWILVGEKEMDKAPKVWNTVENPSCLPYSCECVS